MNENEKSSLLNMSIDLTKFACVHETMTIRDYRFVITIAI